MPYKTNADLPGSVRDHLPPHAQDIYKEAFNGAWEEYDHDESRAQVLGRINGHPHGDQVHQRDFGRIGADLQHLAGGNRDGRMEAAGSSLEQEHANGGILGEAVGEHAAGRAGSDVW